MPVSRRTVILDAAARLFAEQGYGQVGIDQIGAAVEASGPSLYWHFPNKQALLDAVVVTAAERFAAAIEATGHDPSFEDVVRAEVGIVLDHPHYVRSLLLERHHVPADHEQIAAAQARNVRVLLPAIKRLNPDLSDDRAGLRLFTQLGPLSMLTPPSRLPRRRLETLTTQSIVAMAAAPPAPPADPPRRGLWQPTRTRPEAILVAARQLFRARGFENVHLNDIAAAAGLSRPSLYHYFRNKAEILDEAWQRELTRFVVGTWDALDHATSALDALDRLAAAYTTVVLDCTDILSVILRRPPDGPDLYASRQSLRHQLVAAWLAVVRELRPDLDDADRRALIEMAFNVAAWGAAAVNGSDTWHPEVTAMTAAFARG